ncbi:hypothetical protein GW17_00023323 [Ensete ventricosum]|nr:hypothetical protein GW17_00023323 [Ensete ventricosum]
MELRKRKQGSNGVRRVMAVHGRGRTALVDGERQQAWLAEAPSTIAEEEAATVDGLQPSITRGERQQE